MKRPTMTREMILAAATIVAQRIQFDAKTIADAYAYPMDGYRLARSLDSQYGYDITVSDVNALDAMDALVLTDLTRAEQEWVQREGIAPKLPVGTVLKVGVVAGVSETSPARYLVEWAAFNGPDQFLLVRFEDAESEVGDGVMTD